eukprot:948467-Prymnesium_polylepis.1
MHGTSQRSQSRETADSAQKRGDSPDSRRGLRVLTTPSDAAVRLKPSPRAAKRARASEAAPCAAARTCRQPRAPAAAPHRQPTPRARPISRS